MRPALAELSLLEDKVAGTLNAATNATTRMRRGEEEVRVLSSPEFAPVAGSGARRLAQVACRRSGCRFQGKGMNDHLVVNVARRDRSVENWHRRFPYARHGLSRWRWWC
jgi:hypothetical protein